MFKKIRQWLHSDDNQKVALILPKKKSIEAGIALPINGLTPTVRFYKDYSGDEIVMMPVVIYNVEQLASEIAKRIKDGANNSSNGNDDSQNSPKPTLTSPGDTSHHP